MSRKKEKTKPHIKVVGIGECGSKLVNRMMKEGVQVDEYISINTGSQAVIDSAANIRLQIGTELTNGRGAGSDPEVGRKAAEANRREIAEAIKDCDFLLMLVGLGRGTGTGAAPIVAQIARKHGVKTVAIVTTPFDFEGSSQQKRSAAAIEQLQESVDFLTILPNDKFLQYTSREGMTLSNAFALTDEVLVEMVKNTLGVVQYIAVEKKHIFLKNFLFRKKGKMNFESYNLKHDYSQALK